MKIFDTANLDEKTMRVLSSNEASWIYNGLDCCVTAEIYNELTAQLDTEPPNVRATYEYALDKLAPIMEMSLRGTRINQQVKEKSIRELQATLDDLDARFQEIMQAVCDEKMNWRSPVQLKNFFYGMMALKEHKARNTKGVYAPTVNQEALEKFAANYLYARPFANYILVMRDLSKQLGFLRTEIDDDDRMRTNYNLAGTNTGRLASSMNEFGTGTNLQNVNRKLRYPFVADPGMYMLNVDLEQADGRNVGAVCWNLFHDSHGPEFAGSYLDACESGDLHTSVCYMTWPNLDWPEDREAWKKFCDSLIAHGQDSYRQLAKKLGHGTNYYGTPRTMARHTHTPSKIIEDFQNRYFTSFPCIPAWHNAVIEAVKTNGTITTLFGRRRMFFGRGDDAATHRKAIAYEPQSCTGEQIDRGLHQVWKAFPQVQLLNQVDDSILFQIPFSEAEELVPRILEVMQVEIELAGGRKFCVPLDAAGGWNWGYASEENPYGLKGWKGKEERCPPVYRKKRQSLRDHL